MPASFNVFGDAPLAVIIENGLALIKDSLNLSKRFWIKADVQKTILRSLNFDENLWLTNESIQKTSKVPSLLVQIDDIKFRPLLFKV